MVRRLARWVVPLVVLAAVAGFVSGAAATPVVSTAGQTGQAGPAGWRISQVLAGVTVGGLWAGSARDAWLAGDEDRKSVV